jgi:hypothetical protein
MSTATKKAIVRRGAVQKPGQSSDAGYEQKGAGV